MGGGWKLQGATDPGRKARWHLTTSLIDDTVIFDLGHHLDTARHLGREQRHLDQRGKDAPAVKRRELQSCAVGAWLTVVPNRLNGTSLSAEEWRDNIRLRYNHVPQDMPHHCDGCGERMTVEHALACKTGGLVHIQVEREPRVFSSAGCLARAVEDTAEVPTQREGDKSPTEE